MNSRNSGAGQPSASEHPAARSGTTTGSSLLKDISPEAGSSARNFTPLGDRLLFTADDGAWSVYTGTYGNELWITDGTTAGTRMVADINPTPRHSSNPRFLTAIGDRVVFRAYEPVHGEELWVTDGTSSGTMILSPGLQVAMNAKRFAIASLRSAASPPTSS